MRIILSRKGFDTSDGDGASPIFPDGTLLSMPIPASDTDPATKLTFSDISFNDGVHGEIGYDEIWNGLTKCKSRAMKPAGKNTKAEEKLAALHREHPCHLDPDIRPDVRRKPIAGWKPSFGQVKGAQTHLKKQGVKEGDIFIFYGLYCDVELGVDDMWHFVNGAMPRHVIFGYMQIGEIIHGERIRAEYPWQPHASAGRMKIKNNTLYIPRDELLIPDGQGLPSGARLKGYGLFDYADDLVLTLKDQSACGGYDIRRWQPPDWLSDGTRLITKMTYHSDKNIEPETGSFMTNTPAQEYVVEEKDEPLRWAINLIVDHAKG